MTLEEKLQVGCSFNLYARILGNHAGTRGVCYQEYNLNGRPGYSFIFPNGRYDGFSTEEVRQFFHISSWKMHASIQDYQFQNVSTLIDDFNDGHFNSVWKS